MQSLSQAAYLKLKEFVVRKTGISIEEEKREILSTKIQKIMLKRKIDDMDAYVRLLLEEQEPADIQQFIDHITTNTTEFFRENDHFEYIKTHIEEILQKSARIKKDGLIRAWSSACSTGQEPVTLAIVLREALPANIGVKILATDISEKALAKAVSGRYTEKECESISKPLLHKYFTRAADGYETKPELQAMISYRLFNLMSEYHFKHGFDMIFCRNVMIYFKNEVQQALLDKFYDHLAPEGLLFVGHSESFFNKKHNYKSVATAVFTK